MKISLVSGSIRAARESHKPALYIKNLLETAGHTVDFLDLRELDFPLFNDSPEQMALPNVQRFIASLRDSEGIILVFPEYNHSYGSAIKNAMDFLRHREIMHHPVGLVGVSNGLVGGARALYAARASFPTFGCIMLPTVVPIPTVQNLFPDETACTDPKTAETIGRMLKEMELYAPALAAIRANI